jgi:EAL and modified HD-GYP domain-containing signal transduction protein
MPLQEIFLGRQPILDRNQRLVAYELLFRSGQVNASEVTDDLQATASVINHAFSEMGIQAVLGPHLGFINVSADMLHSDMIELLPREQVVLELLETIEINGDIVSRCHELRTKGFSLALDDFVFDEAYLPLLGIVDIVKIDLLLHDPDELKNAVQRLKPWPVRLLAEKVDSAEQAQYCMELGFDLFQGYYFAKPSILSVKRADPAHLTLMKLLGLVLGDAETHEIEQAFKQSPGLTYNLMRLVNSVAAGVGKKIGSVSQAIMVLGRRQLQRWLQLSLFTLQPGSRYPSPLMQLAASRGKFMEILAGKENPDRDYRDEAFMTGILSLLDVLLGMPHEEIIAQLNLTENVRMALLRREGDLGRLLLLAEYVEQADRTSAAALLDKSPGLSLHDLTQAELEALAWVNDFVKTES